MMEKHRKINKKINCNFNTIKILPVKIVHRVLGSGNRGTRQIQ